MNRKGCIAILHYTSPTVMGGVETVIEAHAREFVKDGYAVTVIAGRGDQEIAESGFSWGASFLLVPEMDSLHPEILKLSAELKVGRVPSGFQDITDRLAEMLSPVLQQFDHVFIHNLFTKHFNLALTAALYRILDAGSIRKLVNWSHDFTWGSPNSGHEVHPGYPWDLLRTYRSDIVYVTGSHQRQKMLAELLAEYSKIPMEDILKEIHVIFNGVDPYRLLGLSLESQALIERMNLMDSDLILLMPVRISQAKHIEYALELVAELKALGCIPRLVVTGPPDPHNQKDIERFQKLRNQRRELDIENEAHFVFDSGPELNKPNYIDYEIVGELFRVADIMFMPSHREGFGIPVFEAALAKTPIICSSNVPAAKEIGEEHVTIFDLSEKPRKLAKQIVQRQSQDSLYIIRRAVRQNYTWQAIYQNFIKPLLKH